MSRLQQKLPAMFALAHDHTEGARIELAGILAEICLADDQSLSLREEELVNELIDRLMQTRSPALRAQLIQKFTNIARMPRRIARSLSLEPIDVAQPILMTCETLTDEDLAIVITHQSRDHAAAIAHRNSINEAVADALVVTGDVRIMQLVAENLGAELNQKTVEVLIESARFAAQLREPIMKRPELQQSQALRLYWWVSQDLRRYALRRFGIAAGQIDTALAETIEQMLGYHKLERDDDKVMIQVADWMAERGAITGRVLPQVLRLGHFRLFNIMLGRLTQLELSLVDMIMAEAGGRGLAVLCRALGVDKAGFVSIFLLSRGARAGDQVVHPRELSHALATFERLTSSLAGDLLRSWKIDPSYFNSANELALEA